MYKYLHELSDWFSLSMGLEASTLKNSTIKQQLKKNSTIKNFNQTLLKPNIYYLQCSFVCYKCLT